MTVAQNDDRAKHIDRLGRLATGLVADAMDHLGLPRGGCRGVLPVSGGPRTVGTAVTVLYGRATGAKPNVEYLDRAAPGDVLMLANGGRDDCAVWGGLRSVAAAQSGLAGTFVDGACRDVDEHVALNYPVYARHRTMMGGKGLVAPIEVGSPVLFAGVLIYQGDFVLGDVSGTIVIPRASIGPVVAEAEAIAASDDARRRAMVAGMSISEARNKFSIKKDEGSQA